ncbi:MAG TPA: transporter substrate-binding domain-containing protein [Stellaceae bacterium]|nr:transporter substrate-binding domain-containing protein [Stellaceae bacterium]
MRIINFLAGVALGLAALNATATGAQASEIKVLGNESMPFCGLVDGKPAGMAVEILNAATREGGPSFSFDFSAPWAREMVQIHETTTLAIIPFTRTPEREALHKWIAELYPYKGHLVTVGRATPLKSIEEAKDLDVGVLNGSALQPVVTKLEFTKLQTVANDEINARKISAGRLEAWVVSQYVDKYLYAKIGQDPAQLQYGPDLGSEYHIYIAADLAFPEADAKSIADAVARVRASGELDRILQKYR